jgi:NADH-quinone oxidoreductase subunit A
VSLVEALGTSAGQPAGNVSSDLGTYLPLVLLFVLAAAFAIFSAVLGPLLGPRRYNRAKLDAYECGIEPSPQPVVGGGRVPVAYYLTAMLFILFDIEMVFLYPFAVAADALGVFGLVEIFLFIATVGFAYAYVWRRGGLDWN